MNKYYRCYDCFFNFKLPKSTLIFIKRGLKFPIYCPICNKNNTHTIDKKQYDKLSEKNLDHEKYLHDAKVKRNIEKFIGMKME